MSQVDNGESGPFCWVEISLQCVKIVCVPLTYVQCEFLEAELIQAYCRTVRGNSHSFLYYSSFLNSVNSCVCLSCALLSCEQLLPTYSLPILYLVPCLEIIFDDLYSCCFFYFYYFVSVKFCK